MTQTDKILVGVITGAHGIKGQVRIRSLTEDPAALATYKPLTDVAGVTKFALKITGAVRDEFIGTLKGVADRNAAEALRGTELYAPRAALPELADGEFYRADLVGLKVQNAAGHALGTVSNLVNYGAGDLLEITPIAGKIFFLPFRDAFVPVVNKADGFVTVEIPEGWLENTKQPPNKETT